MKRFHHIARLPALVLGAAVIGLAAAACGIPASHAGKASAGAAPVRCEISISDVRGATTIEGRVNADRPVSGTYHLAISSRSSGGQAMINQSGDFSATPATPATLGQTTLGGSRAQYAADLEVRVNGERLRCSDGRL